MNYSALIHTSIQKKWIEKFNTVKEQFKEKADYKYNVSVEALKMLIEK